MFKESTYTAVDNDLRLDAKDILDFQTVIFHMQKIMHIFKCYNNYKFFPQKSIYIYSFLAFKLYYSMI